MVPHGRLRKGCGKIWKPREDMKRGYGRMGAKGYGSMCEGRKAHGKIWKPREDMKRGYGS